MSLLFTFASAVLFTTASVAPAVAQERTPQQKDSAGVRIITQRPTVAVSLAGARARFSIDGTEAGRDPFHRINGVVALGDVIVIANAGTHELRFYGRDGSPRAVAGRQGNGPGEFRLITWIQSIRGDTLLAYDGAQRRLGIWTASGRHVRHVPIVLGRELPGPGVWMTAPSPLGLLRNNELLYVGSVGMGPGAGIQRATGVLMRSDMIAQHIDSIARVAVIDYQMSNEGGSSPMRRIAFPRMFSSAIGATGFAISEGAEYRIDRYASTGKLVSSIRVQRDPAAVTRRDRDLFLSQLKADDATSVVLSSEFPAYNALWYDRQGRLWAEQFRAPSAAAGQWDVFDVSGRLLVTVSAPAALRLVAADSNFVYAIHTDALDVTTLRAYDLPAIVK